MAAESWGVAERYQRSDASWCDAPPATVQAILDAMGATTGAPTAGQRPLLVRQGQVRVAVDGPARLDTEDGGELKIGETLPPDLPLGYHLLTHLVDGHQTRVIVSPGRCVLPAEEAWGWAVQLYAVRSSQSWGMGDLADLRRLGSWSADLGAGLLLVNPLHAALPGLPQTASPYFPSSRRFRNPLYLRVEEVPGAEDLGEELAELAAAGRALNQDRRIDRDAVHDLKIKALERLWDRVSASPGFDAYRRELGSALEDYATFCVLSEEYGRPWTDWPAEYRHPDRAEVAAYRVRNERRVRFHQWLQWLVDVQLADASATPLVHDLAIGADPAGADAWLWQDVLAREMSVGAPPDEFNTQGQDWGVPPFDPWRLQAAGYEPFVQTVRSALRHAGGIRLDHVMGLFRLFWVPRGVSSKEGTYVRYPASDLLDIVALESHRAGAYVVGEDLGTVEPEVRIELAARNVLSYKLLWFESDPPAQWPAQALAAVTTHDLPTVAGLWCGTDLEAQRSLGLDPNEEAMAATRSRLEALARARGEEGYHDRGTQDGQVERVVEAAYSALGQAPCVLVTATLDDALDVEERPNMPGTTDQWPNWSIALPLPLEDIERDPRPPQLAAVLRRPASPSSPPQ